MGEATDDPRAGEALQSEGELLIGAEADNSVRRCGSARGAARREERGQRDGRDEKHGESRAVTKRGRHSGRTGAGEGSPPSSAWLRGCGTLDRGMVSPDRVSEREHVRVRVLLDGAGESNVSSGLPVLDHLLGL